MVASDGTPTIRRARTLLFCASVWLVVVLVGIKASYLGWPGTPTIPVNGSYLRSLAAIWYLDVVFAASVWAAGLLSLLISRGRPMVPARGIGHGRRVFSRVLLLRGRQRPAVRNSGRVHHLLALSAHRQRPDAELVGERTPDALEQPGDGRRATRLRCARVRDREIQRPRAHNSPARDARTHRRARCRGRMDLRRPTHLHERMGQPAGAADRRESALGPGLILVRRNARRGHRSDDRAFPRCRPDRLRSAGRQAGVAAEGSPHVRFGAASAGQRPAGRQT